MINTRIFILLVFSLTLLTSCSSREEKDCIDVINKYRTEKGLKEIKSSFTLRQLLKRNYRVTKKHKDAMGFSEASKAEEKERKLYNKLDRISSKKKTILFSRIKNNEDELDNNNNITIHEWKKLDTPATYINSLFLEAAADTVKTDDTDVFKSISDPSYMIDNFMDPKLKYFSIYVKYEAYLTLTSGFIPNKNNVKPVYVASSFYGIQFNYPEN